MHGLLSVTGKKIGVWSEIMVYAHHQHASESQEERVSGAYEHREKVEDINTSALAPFKSVMSLFLATGFGVRYSDTVIHLYHSSIEKATITFQIMTDAVQNWWIQVSDRHTVSDALTVASNALTSHVPYNTSVACFILYVSVAMVLAQLAFEAICAVKRWLLSGPSSEMHNLECNVLREQKDQTHIPKDKCKTPLRSVRKLRT